MHLQGCYRVFRYYLAVLFLSLGHLAFAQKPGAKMGIGPAPIWVVPFDYDTTHHPPERNIQGGSYMELFEEQHNLETESVYYKFIRQITSETGVQNFSQISVNFDPSFQQLVFNSIQVYRQGKVINQLDLSNIKLIQNETDLDRFLYSGIYTAYLALEDIRPGDRIEYAFTVTGWNPILKHQYGQFLYFNDTNPISHLFIRLISAPDQQLYTRYFNHAPKATKTSLNGRTVYEWLLSDRSSYQPEARTPPWYSGAAYVQVSTNASWKTLVNWAVEDIEPPAMKMDPLVSKMAIKWNEEADSNDLEYIRLATRFVQDQIRYLGIEMGPYSHLPHAPGQVIKQRYGDCKDKALLLCTFLRFRHIPAHVAFVSSYNGKHLSQYLPSIDLFDHAIVTFDYQGRTHWVDPTMSYQRGNIQDIITPDYGSALIVRKSEDSLRTMHVNTYRHQEEVERFIVPKDNQGSCLLEVTTTYRGGSADETRQQFKVNSFNDIQKLYRDYYNQLYQHVTVIDSLQYKDEPEENRITTIEKYNIRNPWDTLNHKQKTRQFTVYAKVVQDRLPATANEDRKAPLYLNPSIDIDYRIQLVLPEKWNNEESDEVISRDAYSYIFTSSQTEDTINLDYAFQTLTDSIPTENIQLLNDDLEKIKSDLSYTLTYNGAIVQNHKKLSAFSILIVLFSLGLFSFLSWKFYRSSPTEKENHLAYGRPIGGWLILPGILLCFNPLRLLFDLINSKFLTQGIWLGAQSLHLPGWSLLIGFEIIGNSFTIVYGILLLFLFFNRRDILPRAIIFLFLFNIAFLLLDHFAADIMTGTSAPLPSDLYSTFLSAMIWIPYFLYSHRVKETFVYPYAKKNKSNHLAMAYIHKPEDGQRDGIQSRLEENNPAMTDGQNEESPLTPLD